MQHVMRALPLSALLSLVSLIGLSGCKSKQVYPACAKTKHCEEGESCVDKVCQNCTVDADCQAKGPDGEDFACVEFRCTDPSATSSEACDCDPGLICVADSCEFCTEGSQCDSGVCNPSGRCEAMPCATDDECPIDEICDGGQCLYHPLDGSSDADVCGIAALYFGFDSSQLSPSNQEQLSAAATCLTELDGNLVIEAHADNVGTEEYNILLTDQRGSIVREFLVQQGVGEERMRIVGKGALEAQGSDEAGRAQDRRVEFIVEGL